MKRVCAQKEWCWKCDKRIKGVAYGDPHSPHSFCEKCAFDVNNLIKFVLLAFVMVWYSLSQCSLSYGKLLWW